MKKGETNIFEKIKDLKKITVGQHIIDVLDIDNRTKIITSVRAN